MKRSYYQVVLIAFVVAGLFWFSCQKQSTEPTEPALRLFVAKFVNDWLRPGSGEGIIFISDKKGNLLADTTWIGNTTITLRPQNGLTEFPDTISVTTIVKDTMYKDVYLSTNLYVNPATWTWL